MVNLYSIRFITFLVIALVCYYTVLRKKQWICLLIASAVFYYYTGIQNFVFLFLTGFTTWYGAKKMTATKKRRTIMWGVLLVNFGVLACLKYLEPIFKGIGLIHETGVLGLVLPLGISFYTFQSIGYLLDIYNKKYEPEQNFAKYMLFVSYFPQMIQGPINRYDVLAPQFREEHTWNDENATKALYRIFYGLLKKYAIANILAVAIANTFDTPAKDFSGAIVVFAILLYSAQQYADFSGGIDMVLGVSELFGIKMAENFKQPYFSVSLADFWRRWHISLGRWMRDYVFYPFALTKPMRNFGKWAKTKLGKHFGRVLPAAVGNLLVFFLVGIWHGAEWHYVVWGLYNGIVIAMSDILAPFYDKLSVCLHINKKAKWFHVFQIARTFIVVNIGWYFDRITNVITAFYSMKKSLLNFDLSTFGLDYKIIFDGVKIYGMRTVVFACIFVFIVSVLEENKLDVRDLLYKAPLLLRWMIYLVVILITLFSFTRVGTIGGFMYANF